jgi:peptide/nickel transport system substrate-binding protein
VKRESLLDISAPSEAVDAVDGKRPGPQRAALRVAHVRSPFACKPLTARPPGLTGGTERRTPWTHVVRRIVAAAMLGTVALGLSGCASGSHGAARGPLTTNPLRGGTLRVGVDHPFGTEGFYAAAQYALDPQAEYRAPEIELYRCCLLRTLLSYSGTPTAQGGASLRPDLAARMPEVSPDGLVWVFHLKRGLRYAPPFQRREIVASDIVRALEREFRLGARAAYSFYYSVIEGAKAFAAHKADSISGLEVPDPHTLIVHLTEPTGDLGYRFSLPATAPIPPGADRGHDSGDGHYLVSSGPYMVAGSAKLNFKLPPKRQRPASGWRYRHAVRRGRVVILGQESLTLVRNPTWDPRSDPLRKAYPDRIELEMRGGPDSERLRNARRVELDSLDVILDNSAPPGQLRRYLRSDRLRKRLHVNAESGVNYVTLNLAVPPFDDLHVRRALNLVLDRAAFARIQNTIGFFGPLVATEHDLPDSVEGDLLADYDPHPLGGDVAAARAEMARSRYDRNHDGRCDAAVCKRIVAYGSFAYEPRAPDALVRRDFARVGVMLVVRHLSPREADRAEGPPQARSALDLNTGWLVDFPDGAGFAPVLQDPTEGGLNEDLSLLGATPDQLRRWGYRRRLVPRVDQKIAECRALLGSMRTRCWGELDQLVSETIVPWVPLDETEFAAVTSARVARYSFDQFAPAPALDRIALEPGSR